MGDNDEPDPRGGIPNSLTFSQKQVNFILGHSLGAVYQDLLQAPLPGNLQALIDQLDQEPPPPDGID